MFYIREYFPDIEADVYLEQPKPIFDYIDRMDEVKTEAEEEKEYDLFITCDVSALDRLAVAGKYFDTAKKTACIDHHVSNKGFADVNHVRGDVGSACEVLYGLLDADKIDRSIAVPIYTGMAHDTGVFQYSSTTPETMRIAGELMKTGFEFNRIIDQSFYEKTYIQKPVKVTPIPVPFKQKDYFYTVNRDEITVEDENSYINPLIKTHVKSKLEFAINSQVATSNFAKRLQDKIRTGQEY